MKTNKPALALALGLALSVSSAEAGITTLTVTPGAGSTMLEGQDGSSRLFPMVGVTDPNNSANYASVTSWGSAGSYGLAVNANVLAMPAITGAVTANAGTGTFIENLAQVNGTATLAGVGAVGAGSQRIAVGQDATTIAGSPPGTAGAPSANVVSAQGVAGGTPLAVSGAVTVSGLGSPFQAGGSIGNTSFGISGTLPAFASVPTVTAASSGAITAPSVTVSLSSSTTAYATGQLLCSSSTNTTCNTSLSGQSFAIANSAGGASIPRLRVYSNDSLSTAWANAQVQVDLWTAAPTLGASGGDRAAFLANMTTGSAGHLASYSCTFSAFAGDGVFSECAPLIGNAPATKLASGTSVYVTVIDLTASGTVTASKSITVVPEVWN